jgi:ferric-dicitrate binding protein FerR (iron transport regulator)
MEIESNSESLLFRYLRGTVTDTEISEVECWINASSENRKIAEQLCVLDYGNEALKCMRKAKSYHSLGKTKQKIRKNKIHRFVTWTQRVAAVLFIPVLCFAVYNARYHEEPVREQPQKVAVSTAPGVVTTVVLPDNTKVWLNANSRIEYPTYFDGNVREVAITGEVYFAVAKNREKTFFVNVNDAFKLKVTGTEFNIEAYPSASAFSTTLVEGSVEMVSATDMEKSFLTLKPGERSVWDTKKKTVDVQNVNTITFTSWKDGKIIFRNTPITEIATTLSKRYNARFVIAPRLKDYHFTGTFTNQQLVQILEHFKISSNIRYEIKGLDMNPDGTINNTIVELK